MKDQRDEFPLSRRRSKSYSVSHSSPDGRRVNEQQAEETPLPPRRVKFPSNKYQTARWFYNVLIALFLALMTALFLYGRELSGG
ncbi:MAG: hypothetical protein C6W55_01835 [Thermobacillus sp.]|uniref:Uncharacterized protein n=1 Tax=Thermobacillus composti (strain DSM 18247 / JCM 13945 / KWC4) TaxID=717605 RepID=L0EEG9_THECK|nr:MULTISPECIES: hypothetical protein [Thermobacillus]AGA58014.1 hypothetical protein Theco_1884 [Thermobacillus composti KWC4]REK59169.1 MAG: hypothetical protein C6W55_01835 [Thermobacillus sp.]